MEKLYIAKSLIKHNGRRYPVGAEILLDDNSAKRLIELKAVQPTEKTIENDNIPPNRLVGDGESPVQESKTANPEEQTNPPASKTPQIYSTLTEPHLRNEVSDGSVCSLSGLADAPSVRKSVYAEMTNTQQIEYLSALSDEEFKARYDELFEISKSKSKAYAGQRLKLLNKENETQE